MREHHWEYKRVKIGGKWILEHRYIMEKHLGRKLEPYPFEIVHHKDGNGRNNRIENLELMSNGEHASLHSIGKKRYVLLTCDFCEKEFLRAYSQRPANKKQKFIFCSRSCMGHHIWFRCHGRGMGNPRFVHLICDYCNKKFERAYKKRPEILKLKHIFCCNKCVGFYRRRGARRLKA